jgi:hypothetical protein
VMEQLAVQMVLAIKMLGEQSGAQKIQQMLTRSLDEEGGIVSKLRLFSSPPRLLSAGHVMEGSRSIGRK